MKRKHNIKFILAFCLSVFLAIPLLSIRAMADGSAGEIDLSEKGMRIGVGNGTVQELLVMQQFPEAELLYYDKLNGYAAVAQGKIDAYIYDKKQMELAVANGLQGVRILDETLGEPTRIAVGISRLSSIPNLENQVNRFIRQAKQDGTLDDMYDRWVNRGDFQMPEIAGAASPQYHLVVGTTGDVEPYSFFEGSAVTGYDIELAYRLAAWLGADVEIQIFNWDGIVPAVQAGKADLIASNLQVSSERAEVLLYSDTLYEEENGIMVRDTGASATAQPSGAVRWQDYNGRRIGVLTGTPIEAVAAEFFPDSECFYFSSYPDCAAALLAGKIDAYLGDEPAVISVHAENPEIDYIRERLTENNYSFAFRKDDPASAALCAELNAFLAKSWEDGTMEEMETIWLGVDEDRKDVDMSGLTGENGTIRVVTTSSDMPWSYIKDGKNVGYDIDLVVRFCRERGYALELGDVDFAGRIPAIQSGKYDFTTDMNVTPEREEQVLFSDPTAHGGIVLAVLASDLAAPSARSGTGDSAYQSLDALAGKRIGVKQGTYFDALVSERIQNIELSYYPTEADEWSALNTGKIDAFVCEEPTLRSMMQGESALTYIPEPLEESDFGFVFPKTDEGRRLNEEFSGFLRRLKENGTLEQIDAIWFGEDSSRKVLEDYTGYPDVNGTITLATEGNYEPFNYIREGQTVGYDIDIAARFCKEYGYHLDIQLMDFNGIIPSVQTGKCDFGSSAITITAERAESIDFSEPYYTSRAVLAVLKNETGGESFLDSVKASFEKTFLRENRWKLFLEGIGTTMLITVLSILCGTALGFGVYMLCRNGNPVANTLTRFFTWLIQGMPIVVLLMILYYIIFAKSSINGTAVAVIGFTLVFGAAVYGMLCSGVGAVPKGQTEAAYALGYGNAQTFFRIILPQAVPHFLPAYKGEIVALIKATAIVGYIAVQDLTKMGDIVRGRTYEAFFPLIAVAVIYFILAGILTFLVGKIEININPRRRRKEDILKGVEIHD